MFKNAGRVKRTIEEYFVLTVATLILGCRRVCIQVPE